jgi:hypothetical protein
LVVAPPSVASSTNWPLAAIVLAAVRVSVVAL